MVASTFAGMAMDAIAKGQHGLMTAISNGCFTMVGIPDPKLGPRQVEVATMYNTERYRPTLRPKSRPADLPHAGIGLELNWKRIFSRRDRRAAHPRAARPHSVLVRRGGARRGTFSLHHRSAHLSRQADPRTPGRSRRQARAGRGCGKGRFARVFREQEPRSRTLGPGHLRGDAALRARRHPHPRRLHDRAALRGWFFRRRLRHGDRWNTPSRSRRRWTKSAAW